MVVDVCGTGCQIFVENDHKLGCAASVEHTPHPLGRPRSYARFFLGKKTGPLPLLSVTSFLNFLTRCTNVVPYADHTHTRPHIIS